MNCRVQLWFLLAVVAYAIAQEEADTTEIPLPAETTSPATAAPSLTGSKFTTYRPLVVVPKYHKPHYHHPPKYHAPKYPVYHPAAPKYSPYHAPYPAYPHHHNIHPPHYGQNTHYPHHKPHYPHYPHHAVKGKHIHPEEKDLESAPSEYEPKYYKPEYYDATKYGFKYGVTDEPSGNNFNHAETRDGYGTKGSYSVKLPDGRTQKVTYFVDGDSGYVAEVSYE